MGDHMVFWYLSQRILVFIAHGKFCQRVSNFDNVFFLVFFLFFFFVFCFFCFVYFIFFWGGGAGLWLFVDEGREVPNTT